MLRYAVFVTTAMAGRMRRQAKRANDAAGDVSWHEVRSRITAAQRPSLPMRLRRWYRQADEVVSVPVVASVCMAIAAFFYVHRPATGRAHILAQWNGPEGWMWGYGEGSDVVGRVNCTTYVHMSLGTVVELGHGSGGGISFRAREHSEVRWAWEDGTMEIQDSFACAALAAKILAQGGRRGVPRYRLFNRYNREFWIADRSQQGDNISYRNSQNPVLLTLHPRGFTFISNDGSSNITVADGEAIFAGKAANHTAQNATGADFARFVKHGPPAPPPTAARRKGVVVEKVNGKIVNVEHSAGGDS